MELSSEVLLTGPPEAAETRTKEEEMRTKFVMLLAIAAVCVTTAWAGWGPEQQITNNKTANDLRLGNGHKVVVAANGVRHVVWQGPVMYKRYYPGSGWTPDFQLAQNGGFPSIALDPNGTDIHVVWEGSVAVPGPHNKPSSTNHVFYQKCVPGSSGNGGWVGTPRDLTPNGYNCRAPAVACYRDGGNVDHVAVTWFVMDKDTVGFRECVAGTWGGPCYLVGAGGIEREANASISADPQARYGDAFISCAVWSGGSGVYVFRRQNGVWQPRELAMPDNPGTIDYYSSCIEVDLSTGYPHVVSDAGGGDPYGVHQIAHTYWDPGLGWQPVEMLSDQFGQIYWPPFPNMFFSGGSAYVVWVEDSSGVQGVRYSVGQYGNWTAPAWLTSGHKADSPNVIASSTGDIFVVWQDGRAKTAQIWGRLYTPGSGGGMARPIAISQLGVELFPNPTKTGRVTVQYSLPRAEPARVTLLDVSGRAVRTQEIPATGRSGSFSIDVGGLNAGVYVARLVAGDLSVSKSLVVER